MLIRKSQKKDKDAFEKLMNIYMKIIYNYIAAHVSTSEDVKDIVQETMLSIWNGIKNFEQQATFKTWVLGITRRKIADYYRTIYKHAVAPLSEYEGVLIAEDEYDRINDEVTVDKATTVLSKTEKDIVYLIFKAQLNYSEISAITGIPVGTIKSKMSGIKAKLYKQLEKEG